MSCAASSGSARRRAALPCGFLSGLGSGSLPISWLRLGLGLGLGLGFGLGSGIGYRLRLGLANPNPNPTPDLDEQREEHLEEGGHRPLLEQRRLG